MMRNEADQEVENHHDTDGKEEEPADIFLDCIDDEDEADQEIENHQDNYGDKDEEEPGDILLECIDDEDEADQEMENHHHDTDGNEEEPADIFLGCIDDEDEADQEIENHHDNYGDKDEEEPADILECIDDEDEADQEMENHHHDTDGYEEEGEPGDILLECIDDENEVGQETEYHHDTDGDKEEEEESADILECIDDEDEAGQEMENHHHDTNDDDEEEEPGDILLDCIDDEEEADQEVENHHDIDGDEEEPADILLDSNDDEDEADQEVENHHDTDGDEEEDFEMEAAAAAAYRLPTRVYKMLYIHQREGLRWLWSLHCMGTGGILGDDMGLGKTMQVSAFLAGLFHSGLIRRALVVGPRTLLTHWIKELSIVGLSHMICNYYGSNKNIRDNELQHAFKEGGILLTTYDIVRINYNLIRGDFYNDADHEEEEDFWNYVVLDEAHYIKNPNTQRAQSLFEIPCVRRIAISGTPMQNNLMELWAIFNFCCPEALDGEEEFRTRFQRPITEGNNKNASNRAKDIGSNAAKKLRERIKPYFLRRMKSEVSLEIGLTDDKKLPKKNELIIWLKLTDCQRRLYKAFLNHELVPFEPVENSLAALTVLKKICDHPLILTQRDAEDIFKCMDGVLNNHDTVMVEKMAMNLKDMAHGNDAVQLSQAVSCKLSFILSLLRNLLEEGHHVLIFSQTCTMLDMIQEAIISQGYRFVRMDGTTKISERERIVKDFQEGFGGQIFLLTTKVSGLGLTLTKAARVIVVDPAWNPSTDNQSVDRVCRIGQTKDVIVYRLMTSATVEETIYKLQDIYELFSMPGQGFDASLTQKQLQEEHGQQLDMDESLREHIQFLEKQGIAGVSHHSLLFSETEILPMLSENDGPGRGAHGKPKDVCFTARTHLAGKNTDSDITEEINRLSETLGSTTPQCGDRTHELDNKKLAVVAESSSSKQVAC
ncbi:SNF2 domain-containing protein ENL1-like [Hordeum vulgare subsp. vulgare]|uniref:SNF2 domain-containing protein ENL1-like n=1 Tax=Hordeum vulgare subsp. vulgare TaxID=112509 RepID=UPI001D1A45E7|nr:SNF2 domain-containing protein ENL1-like [Hordeum vulgare subsp. vulgare]